MAEITIHRNLATRGMTLAEKLAYYTDKSGGPDACWPWTGSRTSFGHGELGIMRSGMKRRKYFAHRIAWEVANGPIPEGKLICHRCDNPPCCNPAHLFVGTYGDNARDRDAKGRSADRSGANHGMAKLTDDVARAIYAAKGSCKAVGLAYGVSAANVCLIRNKKAWKHIHGVRARSLMRTFVA